ncbi:MAG TPA: hypothetical protein DCM08_07880, partial [Microscillaceae bacterium]|nr:hypothetical protein [Microscillaceae bacterium]
KNTFPLIIMFEVFFDAPLQAVIIKLEGFLTPENYKIAWNKVIALLLEKKCHLILADASQHSVISKENQAWFKETLLPQISQTSATLGKPIRFARIASNDVFNQAIMEKLSAFFSDTTTEAFFDFKPCKSLQEAKSWLMQQTTPVK